MSTRVSLVSGLAMAAGVLLLSGCLTTDTAGQSQAMDASSVESLKHTPPGMVTSGPVVAAPEEQAGNHPWNQGAGEHRFSLRAGDGERVAAHWMPARGATRTVLYCQGYDENLETVEPLMKALHAAGFSVLSFNYPMEGRAKDVANEQGVFRAARAAWEYLTDQQRIAPDAIVLVGRDIGAVGAFFLAAGERPLGVASINGFVSPAYALDRSIRNSGKIPLNFLDATKMVGAVKSPVMVMQGNNDKVFATTNMFAVKSAVRAPVKLVPVVEGAHDDLLTPDNKESWGKLMRFIKDPEAFCR